MQSKICLILKLRKQECSQPWLQFIVTLREMEMLSSSVKICLRKDFSFGTLRGFLGVSNV